MKSIIKSEFFDTTEAKNLSDEPTELIRSGWFITREGRKLLSRLGYEGRDERHQTAAQLLQDYALTLKAIVREELMQEFEESINRIKTFYR